MSSGYESWWLAAVMVAAGIGIPVMAGLNSGLGSKLGNPALAASVLFVVALAVSLTALSLQSGPTPAHWPALPLHYYLGGVLVSFYVLSVTAIAPRLGVGNTIVLVLLGQLVASSCIDHFGWLGAPQSPLSWQRSLGIMFMAAGVLLARRPPFALD